ncbi:MAG: hypothetical protein M3Z03_05620 [Actinomycetota bacterium]|nr:hypothetical protein [Actinomycetota bacterium]
MTLALLLVPGVIGFDLWPLTGWRLFSRARSAEQLGWVFEVVRSESSPVVVEVEDLPVAYRNAPWLLDGLLEDGSTTRREEVCAALLAAAVELHPTGTALRIFSDQQRQERHDGGWVVVHEPQAFHECALGSSP